MDTAKSCPSGPKDHLLNFTEFHVIYFGDCKQRCKTESCPQNPLTLRAYRDAHRTLDWIDKKMLYKKPNAKQQKKKEEKCSSKVFIFTFIFVGCEMKVLLIF